MKIDYKKRATGLRLAKPRKVRIEAKLAILFALFWPANTSVAQKPRAPGPRPSTHETCASAEYRGFDSRLKVAFLGSVPVQLQIVGMEAMNGKVLVATPDALYSFHPGAQPVRITVADHVHSLMVSSDRRIWLETDKGFAYVSKSGVETNNLLAALNGTGIVLSDSGEPSFLATAQHGKTATLALFNPKGMLPVANVPGPIRTASWNAAGLAAVADDAFFTWTANSSILRIVARDKGLETARDAVLLPDNRAVVSLKNAVVLFSPNGHSIVSGYGGRVRFDSGKLYILDSNGALWAVDGIEALGDRQRDLKYVHTLENRQSSSKNDKSSMEAMRITGCESPKE